MERKRSVASLFGVPYGDEGESYDPAIDPPLPPDPYAGAEKLDLADLFNPPPLPPGPPLRPPGMTGEAHAYEPSSASNLAELLANAAHSITGKPLWEARQDSQTLVGAAPFINAPGTWNQAKGDYAQGDYGSAALNAAMAGLDFLPEAGTAAKGLSLGVLHGVPNLFKRSAMEDLARGVNPDKVWHDWGWEKNAAGQLWTETSGKPTLRTDVVKAGSGDSYPPRGSDFLATEQDPNQLSLFTDREMGDSGQLPRRNIPMAYDPTEPLAPYDPRITPKYPWKAGTVADYVANPSLYEQPGLDFLGGLPMRVTDKPLYSGTMPAGGLFNWPTAAEPRGRIEVTTNGRASDKPVSLNTVQHELNHAAAQEFGLPQGFSPSSSIAKPMGANLRGMVEGDVQAYKDALDRRTADYWKHEDEMFDKYGDYKPGDYDETTGRHKPRPGEMSLTEFKAQWGKQNPMLQKILDDNHDLSDFTGMTDEMLAYHTAMGEVSARNAGLRDTGMWTPRRLRELRPEKTEDVPRRYQWTTATGDVTPPAPSIADDLAQAVEPPAPSIRAYHGSPHDFDEFRSDKIGTGEGAQAYGHGLYFAQNPEVAAQYARVVTANKPSWSGTTPPAFKNLPKDELAKIPDEMRGRIAASWQNNGEEVAQNLTRKLFEESRGTPYSDALHALANTEWKSLGHRYEVNIKADSEHFLDWDKPLSEQPHVKQALGLPDLQPDMSNEQYNAALETLGLRPPSHINDLSKLTGDDYVSSLPRQRGGPGPEDRLQKAGIPGIKYLNAGSRFNPAALPNNPIANEARKFLEQAQGDGKEALKLFHASNPIETWAAPEREEIAKVIAAGAKPMSRNYVVFDDKLIEIVKKYGIAGALGAGLISQEMADQMQKQGGV